MANRWWDRAACRSADRSLFFDGKAKTKARMFCDICPVRDECLTDTMCTERGEPAQRRFGTSGGLGPAERLRLERAGFFSSRFYRRTVIGL